MKTVSDLKTAVNTKVLHLVLYSIFTGALFPLMWVYRNTRTIESITGGKVFNDSVLGAAALCTAAWFNVVSRDDFAEGGGSTWIGLISLLLVGVFWVMWAFKAKKAIEDYAITEFRLDLKLNAAYTFLFNVFYINYCINDLPEFARRKAMLDRPHAQAEERQSADPQ